MNKRHSLLAVFALIVMVPSLEAQAVRDSAGVRIVTHGRAATPQRTWRIAPQPMLEIGGADATGPAMFAHIWGAARTTGGHIVVSDEPAQELRVFDASGRHVRTFGRKGRGPGEFSQIRGVHIYGDTIYALDDNQGTALFTLDGKLVRQIPYPSLSPYHPVDPWGVLADGSVVETAAGHETPAMLQQVGARIEMRGLFRIAHDSRSATLLGVVPTFEHYRTESDRGGGDLVAFAPSMTVAVTAERVCTGRGTRYEIKCLDGAGALKLLIRRDVEPVPVSAAARDAYLTRIRTPRTLPGHGTPPQARLDEIAARTHFAATFPAFDYLKPGPDNEVWVSDFRDQDYTRPYGEPPPARDMKRWNVFSSAGAWIAAVDMPARFIPKDIGRETVLGISRDDDGVERVTLYRLLRQ